MCLGIGEPTMKSLDELIKDFEDEGVSGDFDESPITRRDMAEVLKILKAKLTNLKEQWWVNTNISGYTAKIYGDGTVIRVRFGRI